MNFKHSLIALAALAAVSAANAQSNVTLYGRVDLGYQYQSKTAGTTNATNAGSLNQLYNGGILPSIWGVRGTEDLGGGLNAFFNLESHFYGDTGQLEGPGRLFRRQANVGVKGSFGAVALGRQYSPALLAHLATDPRGFKEQFSMLYPYALNQTAVSDTLNDIGVFLGNAVSYTKSFGPVNVGAAYAFGEQAGDNTKGRTLSVGGSYTGPITVSASYQQIKSTAAGVDGDTSQYGVGAAVPVGPLKLKGLFMNTKSDRSVLITDDTTDVNSWGVGVDYSWGASTTTLAYYQAKDKDHSADKTKMLILSNDYALSKRTTLYAQIAVADADTGSTFRTNFMATPGFKGVVQDEKTTFVGVGVKHDF